jgi:RNA polymerase sigma-70 factor (ECF subfamily)
MNAPSREAPDGFYAWVSALVHEHRGRLIRLTRREGVLAEDALDCVQETFVSFLALPQARLVVGRSADSARMLTVLARNIACNRRRRHDYARPHVVDDTIVGRIPLDAPGADEIVSAAEQYALALGCIATLDEIRRAVVRLRLIDEAPGEDVARMLGLSPQHVAVLLFRAKQDLRQCMQAPEPAPREARRPRKVRVAPKPTQPLAKRAV